MFKFILNPVDFIHYVLDGKYNAMGFPEAYDNLETELFNLNLYPQGYRVRIDRNTINKDGVSKILSEGITKFLDVHLVTDFYLDENVD